MQALMAMQVSSASKFLSEFKDISAEQKDAIVDKLKDYIKDLFKEGTQKDMIKAKTASYLKHLIKIQERGQTANLGKPDLEDHVLKRYEDPSLAAHEDASTPVPEESTSLPSLTKDTPTDVTENIYTSEPNSNKEQVEKMKALMRIVDKINEEKSVPHK